MSSLKNKAFAAGIWSSFDVGLRFGIQFVVSIVLARLLSPIDFGIYALTAIFIALSSVLVDGGFSIALVQRSQVTPEEATAVFWYNMIVAMLMAAAIAIVAVPMARIFGHPVLTPLLYASAAIVPLNALSAVPGAMLQRELRFDAVAKAGLAASIISGLLAVVAAAKGAGIWSFQYQAIAYALIRAVLLWRLSGWRPIRGGHLAAARPLARFGSFLALSGLLEVAYQQGAALVIGKLYGPRDLGFYNRGQNLQNLPASVLTAVVSRVLLPVLSTKSEDGAALQRGLKLSQGVVMLINLPLMGALVAMPDLIIDVLYGPKWLPAAPILQILAIGGTLYPLQVVNLQFILAKGRSDLYFKTEIAKKVVGIAVVASGSIYGVIGLAVCQTLFAFVAFFINAEISGRLSGYRPLAQLWDLRGVVALSVAMTVLIMAVKPLLEYGSFIDLMLLSTIGGGFFLATGLVLRVGAIKALVAMMPLDRWVRRFSSPS